MILSRIMLQYRDFPPINYFIRVLKNCPKSALLYIQLWEKKGSNVTFGIPKKDIRKDFLISPTMFRNLLAPLMFLNLIIFIENETKYQIDIMGQDLNE